MKGEFSMQSVRTLFRLDLKSRFGTTHRRGVKYRILQYSNYLFFAAIYALLIYGTYLLTNMFVTRSGLRLEYLVIVSFASILLATAISTGTVIKNLYQNGDNEMLLRFPVSGKEILVAKSIYCYLHNLIVCTLVMLPLYITFGAVTKAPVGDYFTYIFIVLFSSLLPFFIANIIAVPVIKLMNAVKNQFLLVLILTIVAICAAFALYLTSLGNVLNYMRDSNQTVFSDDMIARYKAFANAAYPFKWYAELINGRRFGTLDSLGLFLRFLYLFIINVALGVLAYFITTRQYYKTILYGIETQKASFRRKLNDKQHSQAYALFRREFYLILRSFNYSFQYFAMACAAPVMVFFCNRLAATMGTETVGAKIMPGLTLMVIVIFVTITVSFASTCVSREGNCFYHTKVMPVSYAKQLLIKFCLYAGVATISVALCCLVSGIYYTSDKGGHLLTSLDVGAIFGIAELLVLSLTSLCMLADVNSPTFNVSGDGELVTANKNIALAMILGIVIAVVYGLVAMLFNFNLFSFNLSMNNIYLILALVSLALTVGSVTGLFVNVNKRYARIIP